MARVAGDDVEDSSDQDVRRLLYAMWDPAGRCCGAGEGSESGGARERRQLRQVRSSMGLGNCRILAANSLDRIKQQCLIISRAHLIFNLS